MSINLDLSKIQAYSTALSSKLCNNFFTGKENINGEQILSFTSVQQLNLLIIKTLFDRWKEELQKLKSPYFDYETTAVKEALNSFMNTVSKNISISKEAFLPLVQKAVGETIILCLSPADYLLLEVSEKNVVLKNVLLDGRKYHKIYDSIFQSLQEELQKNNSHEITREELKKIISSLPLPTVAEENNAQGTLDNLSTLLPFDIKEFNPLSIKNIIEQQVNLSKPFGEEAKTESKPTPPVAPLYKKSSEKTILQQQVKEHQLTINDALKPESSIADRFSKSKIEDIKSSIPLNLKFLFINILFDGNSTDYAAALNEIEQAESIEKVKEMLHRNYAEKYKWSSHSEEADEFLKIIERKFY
ncbi:MAG TPA: hypothetical protein VK750_03395 [Cytophagaceae bacterium]|jgi:hypothetical protein|nr:hypothetical protein [Cytophagaceae bacterium]